MPKYKVAFSCLFRHSSVTKLNNLQWFSSLSFKTFPFGFKKNQLKYCGNWSCSVRLTVPNLLSGEGRMETDECRKAFFPL